MDGHDDDRAARELEAERSGQLGAVGEVGCGRGCPARARRRRGPSAGSSPSAITRAACSSWLTRCRWASFVIAWRSASSNAPRVCSPPWRWTIGTRGEGRGERRRPRSRGGRRRARARPGGSPAARRRCPAARPRPARRPAGPGSAGRRPARRARRRARSRPRATCSSTVPVPRARGACRRRRARGRGPARRGSPRTRSAGCPSPGGRSSGPRSSGLPAASRHAPPSRSRGLDHGPGGDGARRPAPDERRQRATGASPVPGPEGREVVALDDVARGLRGPPSGGSAGRPPPRPARPRRAPCRPVPSAASDGADRRRPSRAKSRARATRAWSGPGMPGRASGASRRGSRPPRPPPAAARCPRVWSDQPTGTPNARRIVSIARRLASRGIGRIARHAVEQRQRDVAAGRHGVDRGRDLDHVRHPRRHEQRAAAACETARGTGVLVSSPEPTLNAGTSRPVEEVGGAVVERRRQEHEARARRAWAWRLGPGIAAGSARRASISRWSRRRDTGCALVVGGRRAAARRARPGRTSGTSPRRRRSSRRPRRADGPAPGRRCG